MSPEWVVTFERIPVRNFRENMLFGEETWQHQHEGKPSYFLFPVDEQAMAYVWHPTPNVIRIGNSGKRKFERIWLEENVCEMLSHETLHGVMCQLGEKRASSMFDIKNNSVELHMSGFSKKAWEK